MKRRAFAGRAFDRDFGFVFLQDLFDDDQAQAGSAPALFGCKKRLKDFRARFRAHSDAVVGEFERDFIFFERG